MIIRRCRFVMVLGLLAICAGCGGQTAKMADRDQRPARPDRDSPSPAKTAVSDPGSADSPSPAKAAVSDARIADSPSPADVMPPPLTDRGFPPATDVSPAAEDRSASAPPEIKPLPAMEPPQVGPEDSGPRAPATSGSVVSDGPSETLFHRTLPEEISEGLIKSIVPSFAPGGRDRVEAPGAPSPTPQRLADPKLDAFPLLPRTQPPGLAPWSGLAPRSARSSLAPEQPANVVGREPTTIREDRPAVQPRPAPSPLPSAPAPELPAESPAAPSEPDASVRQPHVEPPAALPPPAAPPSEARVESPVAEPPPPARPSEARAESPAAQPTPDKNDRLVRVFYGTDRQRLGAAGSLGYAPTQLVTAGAAAVLTLLLAGLATRRTKRRPLWFLLAGAALAATLVLAANGAIAVMQNRHYSAKTDVAYGNERGQLEYGVCEVSIPEEHRVGEVESPSILRLEIREDARKHVVLQSVATREADQFFREVAETVARSPRHDAFVFVHGYNVTFENAARRTAQMAYDLKFEGAPIFYSWPSQGGLLKYTVDETNVAWTAPHLKQFLLDLARQSNADAINLIAHSMGNRALTDALRQLAWELGDNAALFSQIVLAAPDIDAEVFRRDIAPAIAKTGRRVTLYASSNDQALLASKQVHGYPRAGDSGEGLVVTPGLDTIDVSTVDTSLVGHSYYGGSDSILTDIHEVIQQALPASQRRWLRPALREGLTYWIFQSGNLASQPSDTPQRQ